MDSKTTFPRLERLLGKLSDIAKQSIIQHRHSAVLINNGVPVSWGYNSIIGTKTHHAEYAAIKSYMLQCGLIGLVKSRRILWGSRKKPIG